MFHKELDRGEAGDNMGALLRGIKREQIKRGMVLAVPGTIKPVRKFSASLYILTKEEGGRYTPFMNNYRPQLFIRTSDVTVGLTFPEGTENIDEKMVMPGDNVEVNGELVHEVALEVGSRFTLREGGKTGQCRRIFFSYCLNPIPDSLCFLNSWYWYRHCHLGRPRRQEVNTQPCLSPLSNTRARGGRVAERPLEHAVCTQQLHLSHSSQSLCRSLVSTLLPNQKPPPFPVVTNRIPTENVSLFLDV